jgi:phage FluMu protein Com
MTARLLLGVVAKEPVYAPELRELTPISDSLICARCDGTMVLTPDAIGRLRKRCPKCDGVAKVRHHPDQVLVPVTLAKLTADALPPVEPGQLRCQRCAKGVDGNVRFHTECAAAAALEKKQRPCGCGARFVRPSGSTRPSVPRASRRARRRRRRSSAPGAIGSGRG